MELIQQRINSPETLERFTKIFGAVHKVDSDRAKSMYEVEKFHFMKEIAEKNIPADVTAISAMGVFLDVVSNGLSFSSTSRHVFLMTRNVNSKRKDPSTGKDIYETRLVFSTQPDGKIYQAQRAGAIDYVTKPVMVYEGDAFSLETNERGNQIVRHTAVIPRTSTKIIAGYVYVVYPNGMREPFWMDTADLDRLKGYSERNNAKWDAASRQRVPGPANALYTSNNGQIDPGFFGAKLINFALKNVRKMTVPSANEVDDNEVVEAIAAGAPDVQQLGNRLPPVQAEPPQTATVLNPQPVSTNGQLQDEPF